MLKEPRIVRRAAGDYQIYIPADQRRLLRRLPGELRQVLSSGHPDTRRLFPNAYPDDPVRAAEYDDMVRKELLANREKSLATMEATAGASTLDGDQMSAWLASINDLRLFLGTSLDVTEETYDRPPDPEDPRAGRYAIYMYLGWLQELVVRALAEDLPAGWDSATSEG